MPEYLCRDRFIMPLKNMTTTGMAVSMSMGLVGSQTAFFEDQGEKGTLEPGKALWLLGLIDRIDMRRGIFSSIKVVKSGLDNVASNRGLTIETARQRMRVADGISLHLRHAHRVYFLHQSLSNDLSAFDFARNCISSSVKVSPLYYTFAQVVFLCIHEVIISSENNNFGNCPSQIVKAET